MDEWEYTELDCHPMRKRISVVPVDHPLVPVWSSWFALNVMNLLTARAPGTVCLDLVRIGTDDDAPVIVWIGVRRAR